MEWWLTPIFTLQGLCQFNVRGSGMHNNGIMQNNGIMRKKPCTVSNIMGIGDINLIMLELLRKGLTGILQLMDYSAQRGGAVDTRQALQMGRHPFAFHQDNAGQGHVEGKPMALWITGTFRGFLRLVAQPT